MEHVRSSVGVRDCTLAAASFRNENFGHAVPVGCRDMCERLAAALLLSLWVTITLQGR